MFEVDVKNMTKGRGGEEEDQLGFGVLIELKSSIKCRIGNIVTFEFIELKSSIKYRTKFKYQVYDWQLVILSHSNL